MLCLMCKIINKKCAINATNANPMRLECVTTYYPGKVAATKGAFSVVISE
jgi:hypothetical protein